MIDQAQYLRRYMEEYQKKKENNIEKDIRVIAVASGKGGVGKTNFSVNLAIALKEMGNSVMVFDADLGLANVDVIAGVVPKYNLYDVIFNNKRIEDIVLDGPKGIKLIPGGSGIESLSNLDEDQITSLSSEFGKFKNIDILIVDIGAGLSKNVMGFMAVSDEVIILTTPEPTSITDAYGLIKVALKYVPEGRFHLVVNRALDKKEAKIASTKICDTVTQFLSKEINYLGYVIDDVSVKKAVMQQTPFKVLYPKCSASICIDNIASEITGLKKQNGNGRNITTFFNKVAYLFSRL